MKKKIMIIGVGWEQIPMIQKAKEMNLDVIVTSQWKEKIDGADKTYWIDSRDIEKLEKIFLEERPDGVIADECDYSMYAVAYLTEKYQLPGPSFKALTITNNKTLQRRMIDSTNVKQPEYYECWNFGQVLEAVEKFGYPFVIKSVDNRGSIGVFIVKEKSQLKDAWYGAVINSHSRKCLAEKFIDGDIITADGFCDESGYHYLASSTKESYEGTTSVAKVLYYPGKLSEEKLNEIEKNCCEIVKSFGITYGFTHFEFIIEKGTEDLYFVEGANRGGGVFISNIVLREITGVDWGWQLLKMSLGEKCSNVFDRKYRKNVIMYFVQVNDGIVPSEDIAVQYDEIIAMHMNKGTEISKQKADARERQGVMLLSGKERESLYRLGQKIERKIGISKEEFNYISNRKV